MVMMERMYEDGRDYHSTETSGGKVVKRTGARLRDLVSVNKIKFMCDVRRYFKELNLWAGQRGFGLQLR
jgi:hypothetical protein